MRRPAASVNYARSACAIATKGRGRVYSYTYTYIRGADLSYLIRYSRCGYDATYIYIYDSESYSSLVCLIGCRRYEREIIFFNDCSIYEEIIFFNSILN